MSGYDFPLFQFLIFDFLGDVFFFSVLVCQQNKWNVQSLASLLILDCWSCQFTAYIHGQTRVSQSSITTAAVLGVSGVIRLDCRIVFLPVYTRKHHKYPVLEWHSSKVFIPNFEACSGRYCLIYRHPFQIVKLSSVALFWFGRYRVWNFMFKWHITG